jgi:hypothetical protein
MCRICQKKIQNLEFKLELSICRLRTPSAHSGWLLALQVCWRTSQGDSDDESDLTRSDRDWHDTINDMPHSYWHHDDTRGWWLPGWGSEPPPGGCAQASSESRVRVGSLVEGFRVQLHSAGLCRDGPSSGQPWLEPTRPCLCRESARDDTGRLRVRLGPAAPLNHESTAADRLYQYNVQLWHWRLVADWLPALTLAHWHRVSWFSVRVKRLKPEVLVLLSHYSGGIRQT